MILIQKKNNLKLTLINHNFMYKEDIINVIESDSMNFIIKDIKEESLFLQKLDLFLDIFSKSFPNMKLCKRNVLETILQTNEAYFFFTDESIKAQDYSFIIKKTMIYNFYHNLLCLEENIKFYLQKDGIHLSEIDLHKKENVEMIMTLLKDIIFCNHDDLRIFFLFDPIDQVKQGKIYKDNKSWKTIHKKYIVNQWKQLLENYSYQKYVN